MKNVFVIKNYEDETKKERMEVKKYYDCGAYYQLIFEDGSGSILKERVIKIIKEMI